MITSECLEWAILGFIIGLGLGISIITIWTSVLIAQLRNQVEAGKESIAFLVKKNMELVGEDEN